MYIISTFKHSIDLEIAISSIELLKIAKENILAIPFTTKSSNTKIFDTMNSSDGISLLDLSAIIGTVFMVLGTIYGYIFKWGPIIWGLIGLISGCVLGLIIDIIYTKKKNKNKDIEMSNQVVLIINCEESKAKNIERILWDNKALGVAVWGNDNSN